MQRNKDPIVDKAGVANAVRSIYNIVQCLKLHRDTFEDMFRIDVVSKLENDAARGQLISYGQGLVDAYITVIITEHCEFTHRDQDNNHYSLDSILGVSEDARSQMTCAHVWVDSEFPFTNWVHSVEAGL